MELHPLGHDIGNYLTNKHLFIENTDVYFYHSGFYDGRVLQSITYMDPTNNENNDDIWNFGIPSIV